MAAWAAAERGRAASGRRRPLARARRARPASRRRARRPRRARRRPSRCAQEAADRVPAGTDAGRRARRPAAVAAGSGSRRNGRAGAAGSAAAPRSGERGPVEAERPGRRVAGTKLRASNGCSGWRDQHVLAHRAPASRCALEGVEQLAERHRGRPLRAVVLVGAGVGDHERLARRRRIASSSSCRSSLRRSRSPVSGSRASTSSPSTTAAAREDAVVEAEQADHPVRHRAHRHHRADGERAGAEVRAGGPAAAAAAPAARARRPAAAASLVRRRAARRRPSASSSSRSSCAGLPARRRGGTAVEAASTPSTSASSHSLDGASPSQRLDDPRAAGRRARRTGRPGRCRAADVVERQRVRRASGARPRPSSTPSSSRSSRCARCSARSRQPVRRAVRRRRGPSGSPACSTQSVSSARGRRRSNPNRRRTGAAARQVEHLASPVTPAAGELEQPRRRTASSGLVWRSARSASRTRSRWPGWPSPPGRSASPNAAEISGA